MMLKMDTKEISPFFNSKLCRNNSQNRRLYLPLGIRIKKGTCCLVLLKCVKWFVILPWLYLHIGENYRSEDIMHLNGETGKNKWVYRQLRARRALLQLKDVPLRTRRALLLYKVNGNSHPSGSQQNIFDLQ